MDPEKHKREWQEKARQLLVETSEKGLTDKATVHSYDMFYPELLWKIHASICPIANMKHDVCDCSIEEHALVFIEIGIGKGGFVWYLAKLFPGSVIVGVDKNLKQADEIISQTPPVVPCFGEQSLPLTYLKIKSIVECRQAKNYRRRLGIENVRYCLVIDDASHEVLSTISTAMSCISIINPEFYVIEDANADTIQEVRSMKKELEKCKIKMRFPFQEYDYRNVKRRYDDFIFCTSEIFDE